MKFFLILSIGQTLLLVNNAAAQNDLPNLETRVYQLSPIFMEKIATLKTRSPERDNPFTPPTLPNSNLAQRPAQDVLTEAGIVFSDGASASFDKAKSKLTVTNTAAELEVVENLFRTIRQSGELQLLVYLEFVEVDLLDFNNWLFENVLTSDATNLRDEVQSWIKSGKAEIVESATAICRSGTRTKVESVDEYIYPTEYHPAGIPGEVTLKDGAEAPVTATAPTAFQTRNLGLTLEVDPVIKSDGTSFELNIAPELSELEKVEQWHLKSTDPKFMTHTPTFYTQKITSQIVGSHGQYIFLGATRPLKTANPKRKSPYILQFVRGDITSTLDWSLESAK